MHSGVITLTRFVQMINRQKDNPKNIMPPAPQSGLRYKKVAAVTVRLVERCLADNIQIKKKSGKYD